MARGKYQQEITMQNMVVRLETATFPWKSVLKLACDRPRPIHLLTFNLPSVAWFTEQLPRLSMSHVSILADMEFREKAEQLKKAYSELVIAVHPKMHSKVGLIFPDRVYISSANLGSQGQHETMVELTSKVLHEWYLETVWGPLWEESEEVSGNVS